MHLILVFIDHSMSRTQRVSILRPLTRHSAHAAAPSTCYERRHHNPLPNVSDLAPSYTRACRPTKVQHSPVLQCIRRPRRTRDGMFLPQETSHESRVQRRRIAEWRNLRTLSPPPFEGSLERRLRKYRRSGSPLLLTQDVSKFHCLVGWVGCVAFLRQMRIQGPKGPLTCRFTPASLAHR